MTEQLSQLPTLNDSRIVPGPLHREVFAHRGELPPGFDELNDGGGETFDVGEPTGVRMQADGSDRVRFQMPRASGGRVDVFMHIHFYVHNESEMTGDTALVGNLATAPKNGVGLDLVEEEFFIRSGAVDATAALNKSQRMHDADHSLWIVSSYSQDMTEFIHISRGEIVRETIHERTDIQRWYLAFLEESDADISIREVAWGPLYPTEL